MASCCVNPTLCLCLSRQLPLRVLLQKFNKLSSILLQLVFGYTINLQQNLRIRRESFSDLFECGCGENIVVMNAEDFAQLLAQIIEFLQTLFNHLFSLRNILNHRRFVLSDAGCTLCLNKLNLHAATQYTHGFRPSRDIGHCLPIVSDIEVLHQHTIQHQFLKKPLCIVFGIRCSYPKHSGLDPSTFGAQKYVDQHVKSESVLLGGFAVSVSNLLTVLLHKPHNLLHIIGDIS